MIWAFVELIILSIKATGKGVGCSFFISWYLFHYFQTISINDSIQACIRHKLFVAGCFEINH
ncbi:hypothetical protein EZS27_039690, partial [termite gut metagenome]